MPTRLGLDMLRNNNSPFDVLRHTPRPLANYHTRRKMEGVDICCRTMY